MKRIIINSFIVVFCLAILMACKKDEITIQKNESTTWEIDKKIVDDDIRTRIGYDPRFQYAYPATSEVVVPMLSLEGFTFTDKNTRSLEIRLSRASAQDVKVSLVYDASLYEKIRGNYSGYELGAANLVEITTAEKTITAGTTSTTFELKVANQANFNKKVILPFAVKVTNNDLVKTLNGKDYFVVKIYPKNVTFEVANKTITKNATLEDGKAKMTNKEVTVTVTPSDAIPTDISLSLERDDNLVSGKTLAPNDIVGTIDKVDFKNKTTGKITFSLQNVESITTKGSYVLPLKLMDYDASGTAYQVLNTFVLVTIEVSEFGIPDDNRIKEIKSYSGALIESSNYSFSSNYEQGHLGKLSDRRTDNGNWWINTYLKGDSTVYLLASFNTSTLIKGVKITQKTAGKRVQGLVAYASDTNQQSLYKSQGEFVAEESTGSVLYLKFEKPIKAQYLMLSYFENSDNQYIDIHELEFF
ncbi:BT_3987 domain-containing protein [Capnocytophaga ochracea]|uniref:DUF1735 domain-containing protein n=1 Tax=Capnocytophaga ochracea TaxID=1018 RepID=A0AA46ZZZ0_CAPOC|nr:DUF1735 domain-containing protein [Capnocytophaga ochracea]UZD41738.1 DUF1735 domain-containing protein [Capnocytophaga ochracea]